MEASPTTSAGASQPSTYREAAATDHPWCVCWMMPGISARQAGREASRRYGPSVAAVQDLAPVRAPSGLVAPIPPLRHNALQPSRGRRAHLRLLDARPYRGCGRGSRSNGRKRRGGRRGRGGRPRAVRGPSSSTPPPPCKERRSSSDENSCQQNAGERLARALVGGRVVYVHAVDGSNGRTPRHRQ
jgi:hypothetical protein